MIGEKQVIMEKGSIFEIERTGEKWAIMMIIMHMFVKNKREPRRNVLAGLVGAVLGGMLVIVSIPSLVKWDVLPYSLEQAEEKQTTVTEQPKVDKSVAVDVVTQVTKAVNKVSNAVVGIVNIQEASFWSEGGEAGTGSGVIYKKKGIRHISSLTITSLKVRAVSK